MYIDEGSMNRTDWEFEYTASTLASAAQAKRSHHEERLAWWRQQKDSVMAEVKDTGIEVSEAVGAQYSNTTAIRAPQVMVRSDLQNKLTECHNKITAHGEKIREYDGWDQVLSANPESRLKLKHADWLFFFAK